MKALIKFLIYHKLTSVFICLITVLFLFNCSQQTSSQLKTNKPIRVLMVGGGTSHNFDLWYKKVDVITLSDHDFAKVNYIGDPDSIKYFLPEVDVLYLANNRPIKNVEVRQAILDFANAGKGLLIAHAAMWYNWKDWPEYNQQIVSGGSRGHDKFGEFDVSIVNKQHVITKGCDLKFTLKDERYYYKMDDSGPGIEILASSSTPNSDVIYPSVFIVKHPKTRIVGLALGHDSGSHDLNSYKTLLKNSIKWLAYK
jgi:type 1 glutamine amidotransferase